MSGRSRGTAGVLALVIGSAALAACGAADGAGAGAASTTVRTSTVPKTTVPTSTVPTGSETSLPGASSSGPTLRVTGTVQEGSRPQCRLLRTPRTSYLLLGVQQRLLVGARLTVVGVVLDNVRTMCPGVPLGVVAVQDLAPPPPGQPTGRLTGGYPDR
jgi:hypothetical protein